MNIAFTPEKSRHQAAARVRQFHRQLVEAQLAPPPPPRRANGVLGLLGFRQKPVEIDWVDMSGAFGRRRQAESVAPPSLRERLRDLL